VASSVTIAGDGDTRILTIAKSGHLLVAGPITLGVLYPGFMPAGRFLK